MSRRTPDNPRHYLGFHVEMVRFGGPAPPGTQYIPFNYNHPANNDPPLLHENSVTRILIFPGSFNPPHKGHLKVLDYVFESVRHDYQVTAAMILVGDDDRVLAKMSKEGSNGLFLTQKQRIALWQEAVKDNDRYWIFDNGAGDEWISFKKSLEMRLEKHTQVEWVVLLGPDAVERPSGVPSPHNWLCSHIITSDAWREAGFAGSVMPKQLPSYGKWEKVKLNKAQREHVGHYVRNKWRNKGTHRNPSNQDVQKEIDNLIFAVEKQWTCDADQQREGTLRYVPFNESQGQVHSSTALRQLIAGMMDRPSSFTQMAESLSHIALNPSLLASYIKAKQIQKV